MPHQARFLRSWILAWFFFFLKFLSDSFFLFFLYDSLFTCTSCLLLLFLKFLPDFFFFLESDIFIRKNNKLLKVIYVYKNRGRKMIKIFYLHKIKKQRKMIYIFYWHWKYIPTIIIRVFDILIIWNQ